MHGGDVQRSMLSQSEFGVTTVVGVRFKEVSTRSYKGKPDLFFWTKYFINDPKR